MKVHLKITGNWIVANGGKYVMINHILYLMTNENLFTKINDVLYIMIHESLYEVFKFIYNLSVLPLKIVNSNTMPFEEFCNYAIKLLNDFVVLLTIPGILTLMGVMSIIYYLKSRATNGYYDFRISTKIRISHNKYNEKIYLDIPFVIINKSRNVGFIRKVDASIISDRLCLKFTPQYISDHSGIRTMDVNNPYVEALAFEESFPYAIIKNIPYQRVISFESNSDINDLGDFLEQGNYSLCIEIDNCVRTYSINTFRDLKYCHSIKILAQEKSIDNHLKNGGDNLMNSLMRLIKKVQ